MRISTFELLLKPITPTPGNISQSDRLVLQGYFLTVANTSDTDLSLRLQFTATTANLDRVIDNTIVLLDVGDQEGDLNGNQLANLSRTDDSKKFTFNFDLLASDTALVILQPDITTLDPFGEDAKTVETRGFVEIFLESPSSPLKSFELLLTPEHRGTFLPAIQSEKMDKLQGRKKLSPDFDQLVYTLPTPNGGSLFVLGGFAGIPLSASEAESRSGAASSSS